MSGCEVLRLRYGDLDRDANRAFDAVCALDNALPHLSAERLLEAAKSFARVLRPGGTFVASLGDYDVLIGNGQPVRSRRSLALRVTAGSFIKFGIGRARMVMTCICTSRPKRAKVGEAFISSRSTDVFLDLKWILCFVAPVLAKLNGRRLRRPVFTSRSWSPL